MTLVDFACPHCSGRFQLENPPPGGQVPCPLCRQMLAIPSALPSVAEPLEAPPVVASGESSAVDRSADAPPPFEIDVGDESTLDFSSQRHRARRVQPTTAEPLSREERERRRQVRNLVWMVAGIVLLTAAAFVLSRL